MVFEHLFCNAYDWTGIRQKEPARVGLLICWKISKQNGGLTRIFRTCVLFNLKAKKEQLLYGHVGHFYSSS